MPRLLERGSVLWLLAACAALLSSGCAPMAAGSAAPDAGRMRIALPSAAWEDWGQADGALPQTGTAPPPETRALALRGAKQELLTLLLLRARRGDAEDSPVGPPPWSGCPGQEGVIVEDAAPAGPLRSDCLRFKRWASQAGWIEQQHPTLARWMRAHEAAPTQPYSHLHYRYATQSGAYVELHAVIDQRLLRPQTRSNQEFLRAGLPALRWSRQLAQAARSGLGLGDGFFTIPPLPFAPVD